MIESNIIKKVWNEFSIGRLIVPILLGLGILAIFGREILFAKYLGTSQELEIFRLAFAIPNMLSQSLAPAFIGAIIPMLVETESIGKSYESNFIRQILRFNFFGTTIFTIIGLATTSWQADLLAPGYNGPTRDYLSSQMCITWFFFFNMSMSFGFRSILNNRNIFWPGASTSLIVGSTFILGCTCIAFYFGKNYFTARTLSFIVVLAGAIVFLAHLIPRQHIFRYWLKSKNKYKENIHFSMQSIIFSVMGVTVFKISNAIPRFIDRAVATGFPQGVVASLEYSYNVLNVPGILLATSFVTVFYPTFVRNINKRNFMLKNKVILLFFLIVLIVAISLGVLLFIWSENFIKFVYGRGAFDMSAVENTAIILKWQAIGLGAMVGGIILSQGLLGFRAIKILILITIIKIIIKLISIKTLVPHFGLVGLAASFVITESSVMLLLLACLSLIIHNKTILNKESWLGK